VVSIESGGATRQVARVVARDDPDAIWKSFVGELVGGDIKDPAIGEQIPGMITVIAVTEQITARVMPEPVAGCDLLSHAIAAAESVPITKIQGPGSAA
jgi:hypothetical protein